MVIKQLPTLELNKGKTHLSVLDEWLDKHWQYARHLHAESVLVYSKDSQRLHYWLDQWCEQRRYKPVRWQMTDADRAQPWSPLLPILQQLAAGQDEVVTHFCLQHQLMGPEQALLNAALRGKAPTRHEYPLPDDLNFQTRRFQQLLLLLLAEFSRAQPLLILISGVEHAGVTGWTALEALMQMPEEGRFLLVIGCNPAYRQADDALQMAWEQWLSIEDGHAHFRLDNEITAALPLSQVESWPAVTDLLHSCQDDILRCQHLLDLLCHDEAARLANRIVNQSRHDEERHWQALRCLGKAQLFVGELDDAITTLDRLLDISQQAHHSQRLCQVYQDLSIAHVYRSDFNSAVRYGQLAVKLAKASADTLLITQAQFCLFVACDKANIPFGFEALRLLLLQLEQQHLIASRVYVLRNIYAQVPFEPRLLQESALDCCQEAIRLANRYHMYTDLAAAFHSRGIIYSQQHRYRRALRCFRISEHWRERLDVPGELARIRNGIGYLLCQHEQYAEAHRYYRLALNTVLRIKDFSEITISLYNLAWVYSETCAHESALLILNCLRDMLRIRGTAYFPFRNLHDVLLLQGLVHMQQNDVARTAQIIDRSHQLQFEVSEEGRFIRPLLEAWVQSQQDNLVQALQTLANVNTACLTTKDLTVHQRLLWHEIAIRIYRQAGPHYLPRAWHHLHEAGRLSTVYHLPRHRERLGFAWHGRQLIHHGTTLSPPTRIELDQVLYLVRQEQRMNKLWLRVHEMRLLSTLQGLAGEDNSEKRIAHETLRLICSHFNAQAAWVQWGPCTTPLASHSLVPDLQFDDCTLSSIVDDATTTQSRLLLDHVLTLPDGDELYCSSILVLPLSTRQQESGHIVLVTLAQSAPLVVADTGVLQFIANQLAGQLLTLQQRRQLVELSTIDPLTGLRNRQAFQGALRHELRYIHRYGGSEEVLALAFIDLDNFKYYNDQLGHDAGDHVLRCFANLLQASLRDCDIACRWGGDEFLIMFPHTSARDARIALARIQASLTTQQGFRDALQHYLGMVPRLPRERWLGCSIGVADTRDLEKADDDSQLLQQADQALYYVKRHGKSSIRLASEMAAAGSDSTHKEHDR